MTYQEWRTAARELLRDRVPPDQAFSLFRPAKPSGARRNAVIVPGRFLKLAETVARHSDARRWELLYRVVWRLTDGERHLLEIDIDPDVAALNAMRRAVEKDVYRMRAFVRFRKIDAPDGERYVAWYRPEHHTLDANGPFFVNRFGSMRWAILTPESSLMWDLEKLESGPGVPRSRAPEEDELEDLWRVYYSSVYNPARLNLTAMRAQLPVRNWIDLPESRTIRDLARQSAARVDGMAAAQLAPAPVPIGASLPVLDGAVRRCRACELCPRATGPVWGEGDPHARLMLVGEQPGDEEDRRRRPFVGPAGQVLDAALRAAGIERSEIYLTNAVKAFRFEERGKRRIHKTPGASHIAACRPWLAAEIDAVRPSAILCLGASAAQSVLGRKAQIAAERGRLLDHSSGRVAITYHPSAILRVPDLTQKEQLTSALVNDLKILLTCK